MKAVVNEGLAGERRGSARTVNETVPEIIGVVEWGYALIGVQAVAQDGGGEDGSNVAHGRLVLLFDNLGDGSGWFGVRFDVVCSDRVLL